MNLTIDLNEPKILEKVTGDRFGRFVSNEWKKLINPYTPRDTGLLIRTARIHPFAIEYIQPYSAYMYFGEVYVDPQTGASGFITDKGWKSRKGVGKEPSGRKLQYRTEKSPYATDHWDEAAEKAGQLYKLYRTLNNALQSGRF